ncbi:MAG TPA: DegT/DnrJ/EryC1/StrS family aminotransferase [Kofleriaceae bacterium]|nr:DegT/DnrJ/EryC1/StrS family aminotransferase [Kofleriaceae bacterium]
MIRPDDHVRWPVLGAEERAAVLGVLERGVLSGPFAPEVRGLEREWAAHVGSKRCIATNSGTAALHVALIAAGIGPGHQVIVPAFTFVATGLAVLQAGAVPVFVDIEPRTLGMDPALVERAITPATRAVMPVHIHGTPCDLDAIAEICRRRGLVLIEDAAQAHGASHRGKQVGTFGALGCFSIQSSKSLPAGEGGLVVTDDDELWRRANRARMFGEDMRDDDEASYRIERALDGNRAYDSLGMGWMYRTTELTAAIARAQLRKLDGWTASAQRNAAALSARLGKLPGVTPPAVRPGDTSCFHKYRVRLDARARGVTAPPSRVRDAVRAALIAVGVEACLWQTKPVPAQGLFRDRAGLGGTACPWSLGPPVDYDLAQYPETTALLDSSLVLFSHTCPIAPQPPALIDAYAEAFERVWERLPELLARTP